MKNTVEFPLLLQKIPEAPNVAPTAVYLKSNSSEEWIRESISWADVDQETLRFLPISIFGNADGVIVYSTGSLPVWDSSHRGIPLKLEAHKLLIPFGTRIKYPVSTTEAATLANADFLVLLPGNRQFSFDRNEGHSLADLLAPVKRSPTPWNLACAPDAIPPELIGIGISRLPEIEELLGEGKDDIGGKNPDGLPRSPDENAIRDALRKLGAVPGKAALDGIRKLVNLTPANASSPTWLNKIDSWASQHLNDMLSKQGKELDRLLNLLKSDPDKGLSFALPLGESGAGRGLANPGSQLTRRNTSFNLGSLFGSGGAISPWMADGDRYFRLQQAYREAANRELTLRRFRRAAYIFGHLLGDFQAAANALEQGGFHREAAIIFEKKLSLPDKAAESYQNGGLFDDALRIFREKEQYEKCGQLLREISREEEAVEAYEQAIELHEQRDEPVEVARIVRSALADEERALEVYRKAWPHSKAAGECLDLEFRLLAQRNEHEEASDRIEELQQISIPRSLTTVLTKQFIALSKEYPNRDVAYHSSDAARRYIGNQTIEKNLAFSAIAPHIMELDREDRILTRDAQRFAQKKLLLPPPDLATPGLRGDENVTVTMVEQRNHFPAGSRAVAAFGFDNGLFTAKIGSDSQLHLTFNPSKGLVSSETWNADEGSNRFKYFPIRSLFNAGDRAIVLNGSDSEPFRISHPSPEPRVSMGSHPFFAGDTIAAGSGQDGQTWKLRTKTASQATLESSFKTTINASYEIELHEQFPVNEETISRIPGMIVTGTHVYFALENILYCWHKELLKSIPLPYSVVSIALPLHTPNAPVAVGMEHGAAVVRFLKWETAYHTLGDSSARNVMVGYTGSNHLVLASEKRLEIFTVLDTPPARKALLEPSNLVKPLCVAPREDPLEFQIATLKQIQKFKLQN